MAATAVVPPKKPASKKRDASAEGAADAAKAATEGDSLATQLTEAFEHEEAAEAFCKVAEAAFRLTQYDMAFAICRAGVHKLGIANERLCKRYLFFLDQIVKVRASANRKDGPPKMLYLRELFASVPFVLLGSLSKLAGEEATRAGEKCVLMKDRGVMVVGLSHQEWRLLLEKTGGSDRMQMISGVEEAVLRGLSQSEGTPETQSELKQSWNAWALKLCDAEPSNSQLRTKCLLQRTALLVQNQQHLKAVESANEVLQISPDNKHAAALLATSQHKAGRKKQAAATITDLCAAFQRVDGDTPNDELGHPLELTVGLLVEMHRTKDALKLLSQLLSRVTGPRQQHFFFCLARLYAKHGLNKDALVLKLPSLCSDPPDRRTWELLKSMAECTPVAVEQQLQKYIEEAGPGHFTHVPHITEVMCKLPFGAHGSAASKALHLLKRCASQVTPDRPEDLRIIVDDLRAFMSSNIPATVSEQFPRTIESLLSSYIDALTGQHTQEAWEMPAELMKRTFNAQPPQALSEQLQLAAMRIPLYREQSLWAVFRHLSSDAGSMLVRSWLLTYDPPDITRMESAATQLQQSKGEHAAALDLMRWAEAKNLQVQVLEAELWRNLYFRVLRHTAEERAASMKRGGAFTAGGLDMTTPVLSAGDCPMRLSSFKFYRSQLTGLDIPLRNITSSEALILREYWGEPVSSRQADSRPTIAASNRHLRMLESEVFSSWSNEAARDIESLQPSGVTDIGEEHDMGQSHSLLSSMNGDVALTNGHLLANERASEDAAAAATDASSVSADGFDPRLRGNTFRELQQAGLTGLSALEVASSAPERQPLLAGQSDFIPMDDPQEEVAAESQMFTTAQLNLAISMLEELQLKQRVPEHLHEDDDWQRFISDLFLSSGWRQLGERYRENEDGVFSKSQLIGDVQGCQAMMRTRSASAEGARAGLTDGDGNWLFALLQEHVFTNAAMIDNDLEQMDPSHACDVLAYDMGQRSIWQQGFYDPDQGVESINFYDAPPHAKARLKLAFMHAADRLTSPRSNRTQDSPGRSGCEVLIQQSQWPLPLMQQNEQIEHCHRLLRSDAEQALAMAQQLMEGSRRLSNNNEVEVLQLICGDACMALEQYKAAISHFSRFSHSHGSHSLPLDALIENVCGMLLEGYPAAQVSQAAEEGSQFDTSNNEGWLLLVKVLAEMIDAESAIEQAAEEENRHMVNKLLMLLGSTNVTNRRERDARMQRCLQEGGDSNSERDTSGRRIVSSRRVRAEENGGIGIPQLQLFWKSLSTAQRSELCKVPLADFEKSVSALAATVASADREGSRESNARSAAVTSDADGAAATSGNQLLLLLHSSLVEGTGATATATPQGLKLADSLCDIKELADLCAGSNEEKAVLDPTISARGLFAIYDDTITLHPELLVARCSSNVIRALEDHTATNQDSEDGECVPLLDRLLAVEAGYELDGNAKNRSKIDMGSQLTYMQVMVLVRTASMLREHAGQHLPHARWALGEMCRRLLRKEPMRAVMAAQRATMATLARLMLRGVRAAFGEEQQRLRREEAERAEQELLESLEHEESKRDGSEAKKKSKKKKRRTGAADGTEATHIDSGGVDGTVEDGDEDMPNGIGDDASTGAVDTDSCNSGGNLVADGDSVTDPSMSANVDSGINHDDARPQTYSELDDPTMAGADSVDGHPSEAASSSSHELTPTIDRPCAHSSNSRADSSLGVNPRREDSAAREAREAAEALAVVEAEEAAEEAARLAVVHQERSPSENVWEEAQTKRSRRKPKGAEPTGGAQNSDPHDSEATSRHARRRVREAGDACDAAAERDMDCAADVVVLGERSVAEDMRDVTGVSSSKLRKSTAKARSSYDESMVPDTENEDSMLPTVVAEVSSSTSHENTLDSAPSADESSPNDGTAAYALSGAPSSDGALGAGGSSGGGGKRNKRGKASDTGSLPPGACTNGSTTGVSSSFYGNGHANGCVGVSGTRGKGKKGAPPPDMFEESASIGAPAAPGLENKTGQHSCFVNVVVQTLWNVSAFRDAFLTGKLNDHASEEDSSIYVAMKEVCSMMDSAAAGDRIADPNSKQPRQATASALKEALYRLDSNFELGEMHDATEAHEALLEALHRAVAEPVVEQRDGMSASSGSSDEGSTLAGETRSGSSFVKEIFSMRMRMEYAKPADPKEEPSKPLHFDQWTQYIVASELRNAVHEAADVGHTMSPLVRVLRKEAGTEPVCEGGKCLPVTRKLNMLEPPLVFTLGLSNDSARASKLQISESLQGIEEILNLRDVYDGLTVNVYYRLVALTAFYESHYVCFCFSQAAGAWIHYDDDTRRLVGADFAQVKEKCIAGRLHPQLCFFESIPSPT